MNAGQHLVALSGLASGTAAAHLLAIQAGTGTGQTIFASQFTVSLEEPRLEATIKPKKVQKTEAVRRTRVIERSADNKNLFCTVARELMFATVEADQMTVRLTAQRAITVQKFAQTHYATKSPKSI